MFEEIKIQDYLTNAETWLGSNIWTANTFYQVVILFFCFSASYMAYIILKRAIEGRLQSFNLPVAIRRIYTNLLRLIYPLIALIFLFFASVIAGSDVGGVNVTMTKGIMKVLLAWIVIRIAVQFIANSAMRNFFALVIWSIAALSIFGVLEGAMAALDAIAFSIGDFRLSALAVIKSILMLFTLLYAAIFVSSFAERRIFKAQSLTRSSQVLIAKVVRITLIVFALIIGVTSAGIDLSIFAVFGGAIGLGIGFGLQKVISNLFSGMLLLMDRSIKPGDVIEIPDIGTFGWVNQMSARYTEIVTRDNKSVLIPNEDFITQRVLNWSHGNSLIRVQIHFGVHYDSDMEKVVEIACEAAKAPERVVDYRQPVCWITEFGDSSVNFSLRFWIKDAQEGMTNVKGLVFMELWKAFKENNIQIPYPHREVYLNEAPKAKTPTKKAPKKKAS